MTNQTKTTRSFPQAREFLSKSIVGSDYPVKHLIEQARNKGHITRGKRGRGGGIVTSRDMAILMLGSLAGDTPQSATDAMAHLAVMRPSDLQEDEPAVLGVRLNTGWWRLPFVDVVAGIIDAWRGDSDLDFDLMSVTVARKPSLYGQIDWLNLPYERDLTIRYFDPHPPEPEKQGVDHRFVKASFQGEIFQRVADWLENREEH